MAFDFPPGTAHPAAPVPGDVSNGYSWDGEKWTIPGSSAALPVPSNAIPLVDGIGAHGSALPYAREDHVHPLTGGWNNVRLSKTAAYTAANADKGATIALGGAAFYPLTFAAAAGYDANYAVQVLNEDGGRGKTIACNGLSPFILWPGQSCQVYLSGGVWHVSPSAQRWAKQGATFYVDVAGSDSNDGQGWGATAAFRTITQACLVLYQQVDCQNSQPTIYIGPGTFIENVVISGQLTGYNFVLFAGSGQTQTIWKPTSSPGACLQIGDNAECQVQQMKFDNIGGAANQVAIGIHQTAVIDVLNGIEFGSFPGAQSMHFSSDHGGFINMPANYTISGPATWHFGIGPGTIVAQQSGGTIFFTGNFTIGIMYRMAVGAVLAFSGIENYALGSAAITQAYYVDFGSMIQLNGTVLPGGPGQGNGVHSAVVA